MFFIFGCYPSSHCMHCTSSIPRFGGGGNLSLCAAMSRKLDEINNIQIAYFHPLPPPPTHHLHPSNQTMCRFFFGLIFVVALRHYWHWTGPQCGKCTQSSLLMASNHAAPPSAEEAPFWGWCTAHKFKLIGRFSSSSSSFCNAESAAN